MAIPDGPKRPLPLSAGIKTDRFLGGCAAEMVCILCHRFSEGYADRILLNISWLFLTNFLALDIQLSYLIPLPIIILS